MSEVVSKVPLRARENCWPRMNAYWRAANYLSVGQIYLKDNPMLERPLTLDDVEATPARPLGHHTGTELSLRSTGTG